MKRKSSPSKSIVWAGEIFIRFDKFGNPYLCDMMGYIYTKKQIEELIKTISIFYSYNSDEHINHINNYLQEYYKARTIKTKEEILALTKGIKSDNWIDNILKDFNRKRDKSYTKNNNVGYIYLIRDKLGNIKIGKSINYKRRINDINNTIPQNIDILLVAKIPNYGKIEAHLHRIFKSKRLKGEWFKLNDKDLEKIEYIVRKYKGKIIINNWR